LQAAVAKQTELAEIARQTDLAACQQKLWRQRKVLVDQQPAGLLPEGLSLLPRADRPDLQTCFGQLQRLAPQAFAAWKELLEVNARAYDGFPLNSCSISGHEMAEEFRAFVKPYLRGAVLDVGCGPQPTPYYLRDYPPELIAGVDPLPPTAGHPFVFVQTLAEFLPWDDRTFSAVVVATSLDHVLLLDRALAEFHRVLRDDGHLLLWVTHLPGAAKYDPYRPDIRKVDDYHLFHFDRPWFEEAMSELFAANETVSFPGQETSWFYSYRPRPKAGQSSATNAADCADYPSQGHRQAAMVGGNGTANLSDARNRKLGSGTF
jgi:SAM-dependent methyltransferase